MRQTLELALEALERSVATCFDQRSHDAVMGRPEHFVNQAITAIKEALAQPEQEPVAYINIEERKLEWAYKYMSWDTPTVINLPKIPLYTTPPQRTWVGLTEEEIDQLLTNAGFTRSDLLMVGACVDQVIDLVANKLKEKNA